MPPRSPKHLAESIMVTGLTASSFLMIFFHMSKNPLLSIPVSTNTLCMFYIIGAKNTLSLANVLLGTSCASIIVLVYSIFHARILIFSLIVSTIMGIKLFDDARNMPHLIPVHRHVTTPQRVEKMQLRIPHSQDQKINDLCLVCMDHMKDEPTMSLALTCTDDDHVHVEILPSPLVQCFKCKSVCHLMCLTESGGCPICHRSCSHG